MRSNPASLPATTNPKKQAPRRGRAAREKRDELARTNEAMVRRIARDLQASLPPCFELDDLIQTGMVALLQAAERYRPKEHDGAPFGPYARKVIRGAMLDSVSGPRYRDSMMAEIYSDDDVQAEAPTIDDDIDAQRRRARLNDAIEYLDPRRREIIRAYYSEGATLKTAAGQMGLSKSHLHELTHDALKRLRMIMHA